MTYTNKKYTEAEIIEALTIIQNICKHYADCDDCPFSNIDAICKIQDISPSYWNIKRETTWRAFE